MKCNDCSENLSWCHWRQLVSTCTWWQAVTGSCHSQFSPPSVKSHVWFPSNSERLNCVFSNCALRGGVLRGKVHLKTEFQLCGIPVIWTEMCGWIIIIVSQCCTLWTKITNKNTVESCVSDWRLRLNTSFQLQELFRHRNDTHVAQVRGPLLLQLKEEHVNLVVEQSYSLKETNVVKLPCQSPTSPSRKFVALTTWPTTSSFSPKSHAVIPTVAFFLERQSLWQSTWCPEIPAPKENIFS